MAMRIGLTVICISLSWGVPKCPAAEPPRTSRKAEPGGPAVPDILREASEIILKQEEHQHYWSDRVLLHIAEVQVRARDFDGAFKSIRGSSYEYGRNAGLVHLAETLARDGKRERAFEVFRPMDSDHGCGEDYSHDLIQLRWIEHVIASGDLGQAGKAIEQLKSKGNRSEGLRKLAVAYAKAGDAARAEAQFTLAIDAASGLKDEVDRGWRLWETADAQLSVGKADAAKATIRQLAETSNAKDTWAKFAALWRAAVLAAKAKDDQTAHQLFRRAIDAQKDVNALNKLNALNQVAVAQADAGYIQDALKTASMVPHSENDFSQDGTREEALYAIAVAQLKANDVEGAVRTALSVKYYLQYRDDALHKIVDHQIAKRDLKAALTTAQKVDHPSRKATAILRIAAAHAKAGDRKTAADVAAQIDLAHRDGLPTIRPGPFDYRIPRSWGISYDAWVGFTAASHFASIQRTAEVAAAAMTLAQALEQKPAQSYALLFNEIYAGEIIQALARAHAASGDAGEALAWAKQIGTSGKIKSTEDSETRWAVERRVHALVGVAEGILDRSGRSR
jgi:hypothetical protein